MTGFHLPQIPHDTHWITLPEGKFIPQTSYSDLQVEEFNSLKVTVPGVHINVGLLNRVNFSASQFDKLNLLDVYSSDGNFSNFRSTDCNWARVKFKGCKLTGLQLVNPILEDVIFENCNGPYLQLRFGHTKHLIFKSCNLHGADFESSDLSHCEFINCDLTETEFSAAKLAGADLRGSNLEKMVIGINEIKGVIVNTTQALFLTSLLGVNIQD